MKIRFATDHDSDAIKAMYLEAFQEKESVLVAELAVELLLEQRTPATISIVIEDNTQIVGHIAFSPVTMDHNPDYLAYILSPLAVSPSHQRQGFASQLIEFGKDQLIKDHVHMLFVYGDPTFYERFGFNAKTAEPFIPPYRLGYPFGWLGLALSNQRASSLPTTLQCTPPLSKPELW